MAELKWLEGYSGESIDELIALAATHRVDSIVLAIEQALQQRTEESDLTELSEAELTVLAVEALEREVNNGGYDQFFFNTPQFAPLVVDALKRIACPKTAEISAKAIALLGLRAPFTGKEVKKAIDSDPTEELMDTLSDECDDPYYDSAEPIADRLFEYVRAHRESIRLA